MTMGMTMIEGILARRAQRDSVAPGDMVVVPVDTTVVIDLNFYDGVWYEPTKIANPDGTVVIFDHMVPAPNREAAAYLARGRAFVERTGVTKFHDAGRDQGISHQIIAEQPYAFPGDILVCSDSHTCAAGALGCAARGLGPVEVSFILAKGYTWFLVGPTIRYELSGVLSPGVSPKDVFLQIAAEYGDHVGHNVEFGGPGMRALSIDQRRQLTTMCAEISADFALCEPDDVLAEYFAARGHGIDGAVAPEADAAYADVRQVDLGQVETMVGRPDSLVHNSVPISEVAGTSITHAFIGSCANGTLDDLREAARILEGRSIDPSVTMIVTPSSQAVYRAALREGVVESLTEAGALVTTSSCGMCAGFQGALAAGDVCITSSTRNFKGRMGAPTAEIYMGSSATVATSALAGEIVAPMLTATSVVGG
jgi:3-isopropylmalate/(R)-2-methylmalate dehydratase large subunit